MASEQTNVDPRSSTTILVGLLGIILVFVAIVAVQALFYNLQTQQEARANQSSSLEVSRLHAKQLETISSYGWKDREKGIVTVPVERAMEVMAREASRGESPESRPGG